MNFKYTSDGRKVVVIGSLNAQETIVQEVYVCDGSELPAGEHFVVKTLLDKPCETYKVKEEKRLEVRIKELEKERDRISLEIFGFKKKLEAANLKLSWVKGINEPELDRTVNRIMDFLRGEITHVLFCDYGLEIEEVGIDAFAKYENEYGRVSLDGIRLVSLFGNWNGRLEMDWKVNCYKDGSGSWRKFIPCKSLAGAVDEAAKIIYAKDCLGDKDFDFCVKYSIEIDSVKNAERLRKKREDKEIDIANAKENLNKLESELAAIG